MRVFLSYASEDRRQADGLAVRLQQEEHEVFFDRQKLPPGDAFDALIRAEIGRSHLMIFLISPDSVRPGSYTLSELGFARKIWRAPKNRVLPVMARKTPIADIPPYLLGGTLLEPQGELTSEVLGRVADMSKARRWRWVNRGTLAAVAVAAAALGFVNLYRGEPEKCFLQATVSLEPSLRQLSRLTLNVRQGDSTETFHVSDRGVAQIGILYPHTQSWYVELVDGKGDTIGQATLHGCPPNEGTVDLGNKATLTISSR